MAMSASVRWKHTDPDIPPPRGGGRTAGGARSAIRPILTRSLVRIGIDSDTGAATLHRAPLHPW